MAAFLNCFVRHGHDTYFWEDYWLHSLFSRLYHFFDMRLHFVASVLELRVIGSSISLGVSWSLIDKESLEVSGLLFLFRDVPFSRGGKDSWV